MFFCSFNLDIFKFKSINFCLRKISLNTYLRPSQVAARHARDDVGTLGSGSDYTAYLDHLGIPSLTKHIERGRISARADTTWHEWVREHLYRDSSCLAQIHMQENSWKLGFYSNHMEFSVTTTFRRLRALPTARWIISTTAVEKTRNYAANLFKKWIQERRPTVQVPDTVYAALVFVYR